MDTFLNKLERLSGLAAQRPDPLAMDLAKLRIRLASLPVDEETEGIFSLPLFAGTAALASLAAAGVVMLAFNSLLYLESQTAMVDSLMEVMENVLLL
ncbi:MAG: hypothetical protein LBU79_07915 [Planctomycetota bacterium]|jgi:uncharacterized membrane protein YqjE|nr:hypothetical protein [Planctomycetota bacterium]